MIGWVALGLQVWGVLFVVGCFGGCCGFGCVYYEFARIVRFVGLYNIASRVWRLSFWVAVW